MRWLCVTSVTFLWIAAATGDAAGPGETGLARPGFAGTARAEARGSGSSGFNRAIASAIPPVVKLYGLGAGLQAGYGSGCVVSEDGLVLTVFSLLIDARRIRAVAADGTHYGADVVYRDRKRQLALLRLKPAVVGKASPVSSGDEASTAAGGVGPLPFFDLSRETTLTPGDWVLAAGNAFKVADGAEPVSLAHGIFSIRTRLDARRRLKDFPYRGDVLVIDAITSNPGAPGSALVNLDGEFVGMIGRVVVSNLTHTHFNYAVPRDVLYDFFLEATNGSQKIVTSELMRNAGRLFDSGIRLSRFGYRTVLPFVERIRAGSAAARAGVRKDDLILSVNGRTVPDATACEARMRNLAPGEPIDLVIRRGRTIVTVRVEPDEMKSQNVETSKRQNRGASTEE